VPLFDIADSIAAENRLRIALSTSYWPILWPAGKSARVALHTAHCKLLLPVRAPRSGDRIMLGEAEAAPSFTWTELRPGEYLREESTDPMTDEHRLSIADNMGTGRIEDIGVTVSESTRRTFRIRANDPASAALETETICRFSRDNWSAETTVRGMVSGDGSDLIVIHEIEAREGGRKVYSRDWCEAVHLR
jgi:hypothetical protein